MYLRRLRGAQRFWVLASREAPMTTKPAERLARRDETIESWAREHDIELGRYDEGQRWAIFMALQLLAVIG